MSSDTKLPLIIAHRGASAFAPENTLAAFNLAIEQGADGIELDVRLASDGVPVVIHDATLSRTAGLKGSVANFTSAELANLDVGSWFNRKHRRFANDEYANEHVPTLEQIISLIKTAPQNNLIAYLELKTEDAKHSRAHLAESVYELITEFGIVENTVIVSFDHETLVRVKVLNPSVRTGALFAPQAKPIAPRKRTIIDAAIDCGAEEILLHRLMARRKMIESARDAGLAPVVWTVDDQGWIARAQRLEIHAIISNDPAKMKKRQSAIS